MKTNAIVRIVLFSIAILVLLGILGVGLAAGMFMTTGLSIFNEEFSQPLVTGEDTNSVSVDAASIRELEIEWVAGKITIMRQNTTQITVTEPTVTNDKYKMVCKQSGDTLKIQFSESDLNYIGIHSDLSKDLVITVPMDWVCEELDIDTAAATVEVSDMTLNNVDFDGASGICTFTNCTVGNMELDTASGDVRFTGKLDSLKCNAMSANCEITVNNVPKRIDLESMSGDLDITLPEDCGFTVSMDGMSSDFSSDFQTTTTNGHYVHGDGSCRINVEAMSGDVTIRKGAAHNDEQGHY